MSKNTTKLVHATTFLGASATRSRIANCFCPKDEGRSLFCDASGMIVEIWGNRRSLRNDQFADVFSTQGWFWTTVSVVTTDGLTFKISGLPKTDARALVEMLAHNHLANVRQVAAQLFEHLDKADVEVARLTGGGRYVAAHMVRHLLSTVERLAPLTRLKIRSGMLAPDVETKLRRVADFIADHERKRSALNTRFIETELLAMRSFFDRVESNPLTSPQCRAVVADEDRNLVVAAAGSGKTSVIVAKVAYLIHKGQRLPNEIW